MAKGYCNKHYLRLLKYGDPLYTKLKKDRENHGMCETSEYGAWCNIKNRCYNKKNKKYEYYGGRGISVCDRWLNSFTAFFEDMGPKPFPEAQIDRIDNDGNYEPGNCRWATHTENIRNSSGAKLTMRKAEEIRKLYKKGRILLRELAIIYGVHISTIGYVVENKNWKSVEVS